jgi:hypothetical protein
MTPSQITPAWFDQFWAENCMRLPILMRGDSMKQIAWQLFQVLLEAVGREAKTPHGLRTIVAFAKIQAIMQGSQHVLGAPEPTPEQVAEFVQRLVDRSRA